MARMKPKSVNTTVLFDVFYEDGSRTSNRKVPGSEIGGLDGDTPARAYIEAQDRQIGGRSGLLPRSIKRIVRSAG
jgi:hypothetical protein